jgi:hypothetical protein
VPKRRGRLVDIWQNTTDLISDHSRNSRTERNSMLWSKNDDRAECSNCSEVVGPRPVIP